MSPKLDSTWKAAQTLPHEERAELVHLLLASLDEDEGSPGWDAEWEEEIERRAAEVEAGLVELIPADEVFRELELKYGKRETPSGGRA